MRRGTPSWDEIADALVHKDLRQYQIRARCFRMNLKYDWANPRYPNNDRLIFSKGHACPLLYSMFKAAGAITDAELLSLRKLGSRLQGHPNPHVLPYVDVATGSLGQGLPIGVGMALNGKYIDKLPEVDPIV